MHAKISNFIKILFEDTRYLVLGIIDGVLVVLGVMFSGYALNIDTGHIFIASLAGGIGISISCAVGTIFAELAEAKKDLRKIESQMLSDLSNTHLEKKQSSKMWVSTVMHGLSAFFGAILPIIPLLFMEGRNAYYAGIFIALFILFSLGIYLGKIIKKNLILYGILLTIVGVVVAVISYLLGAH